MIFRNSVIFALLLSSVNAQTILTLDQCLSLAHQHNLQLKIAQGEMRSAILSRNELQTSRYPQIRFGASAIFAPSSGHLGYDPALSNLGQISGQIIAQHPLYDGGIRNLKTDQLGIDIDISSKEYKKGERDLVFLVKQAFIETLRSAKEIELQTESVRQLREYLEIVKQLSAGGNGNYTDILKTTLQLSNAQMAYEQSLESFSVARYNLAELLGGTIDTSFNIAGELSGSKDSLESRITSVSLDSTSNLELSIASLSIRRSLTDIELTKHELSPTVSLIGDIGLLTSGDNLSLPYDSRSGFFGFSVGVLLEVPLFTWGANDLRIQQREVEAEKSGLQTELLQRSITTESKKITLQLKKLRERLLSLHENLKSAEENFFLTRSKYLGGNTISLDVLTAQQLLTETKLLELQTMADIQVLVAKLDQIYTHE